MNKTTPQPTLEWEKEFKDFESEYMYYVELPQFGAGKKIPRSKGTFLKDLKDFIKKVDQEAYERGWKGGVEDRETFYKNYKEEVFTTQERNRILALIEERRVPEPQGLENENMDCGCGVEGGCGCVVDTTNELVDELKNLIIKE